MRKTLIFSWSVAALVLVGSLFGNYHNVFASIGLSIQPLKVSETLKPGDSLSGIIQITNASDSSVNVDTQAQDFVPLEGTYNIQFIGRAPGLTTVRDWISLDTPKSFILQEGETKKITYTIRAPLNAEPGGHFGVIFFKASPSVAGQQIKVSTQVGTLILISIPGSHLEKGDVLEFTGPSFVKKSPIDFSIKFKNTGTVHFEPKGTISITNMFGKEIGNVAIGGQVVLPTGIKDLLASVNYSGLLLGRYIANLKLLDGESNELAANKIIFYAFPVWYIVGFIITATILFLGFRFLKKNIKITIVKK